MEERDFAWAIRRIKNGKKCYRTGWNGKGMWIRYINLDTDKEFRIQEIDPCEGTWMPFIAMKTTDNKLIPWLASQTDMLASDWEELQ